MAWPGGTASRRQTKADSRKRRTPCRRRTPLVARDLRPWPRRTGRGGASRLLEGSHSAEFLVAFFHKRRQLELLQIVQSALQIGREKLGALGRIAVGAAGGFGNDLVDDAEALDVARGDFHRRRRI